MATRYGAPGRGRRRLLAAAVAVLAAVFLGWLAWAAWFHGNPDIRAKVTSFEIVDDHEARARLDLRLADDDVTGSCLLRATAVDHGIVGEHTVRVEEHAQATSEWVSIRTERRATSVTVEGCTAD